MVGTKERRVEEMTHGPMPEGCRDLPERVRAGWSVPVPVEETGLIQRIGPWGGGRGSGPPREEG